jgi:hypothetical protein
MWVSCCFVIATPTRRTGYGRAAIAAICLALLSSPATVRASSVAYQAIRFGQAVTMSARVVKGTVKARGELKVDGGKFHYVEIAVEAVLKGPPLQKTSEPIRVFDGAEWFRHTHAAAIKGGVVSYAEPHYATPIADAQIKPGAAVIAFLRGEAPPPGFPANAAFLICGECYERPERAADVARMRTAAFGDPITLKMGEVAVLPDGLELEIKGHTHKRPLAGGSQKEMVELEARIGTRADLVAIGHLIEPGATGQPPRETWQTRTWAGYELVLVGMKHGSDTTLRVVRKPE